MKKYTLSDEEMLRASTLTDEVFEHGGKDEITSDEFIRAVYNLGGTAKMREISKHIIEQRRQSLIRIIDRLTLEGKIDVIDGGYYITDKGRNELDHKP